MANSPFDLVLLPYRSKGVPDNFKDLLDLITLNNTISYPTNNFYQYFQKKVKKSFKNLSAIRYIVFIEVRFEIFGKLFNLSENPE